MGGGWNATDRWEEEEWEPLVGAGQLVSYNSTLRESSSGGVESSFEFSENYSRHLTGLNRTPTNISLEMQLLCGTDPNWEEINAYR
jgi:hypothetical protein